ncbi:molybdopterin-dependent oxidoreductase [Desulfomonile tiedjei]|uniref:Anaerobic dehydrogenase, typically selenocysteine-containing n=1 Tax=Desulfomonile tiedjei (strain ATCC 49306 / DSM 6799 / DCB-1) TaxID=706587 RepID=I4C4F7_DESTA|nr:molybdopterin-dependent oxidoreductase [Desulfomonile tiedjei]AFM24448.1 anaerobic dehydrogenase, typically selenocysteine-containing [Desulfomonile tiedjei DSM 6799]
METVKYSQCEMCSARCPIEVTLNDGVVSTIFGNPNVGSIGTRLCAKGAAGKWFLYDTEKPGGPKIRVGPRGGGEWRDVSWDEAYTYVAERMSRIKEKFGPESVLVGYRGSLNNEFVKSFARGYGTPNDFTHNSVCPLSLHTACQATLGVGRKALGFDIENAEYVVLYGRNIFESLTVAEVNQLMAAMDNGVKIVTVDPRASKTAVRSYYWVKIRPGGDWAFNLALMNEIIKNRLYDEGFVNTWVKDFDALRRYVEPYTPEWAEKETDVEPAAIRKLAREFGEAKPKVIFHIGWFAARYVTEFHMRRSILFLNALMGSYETPGGLFFKKGLGDTGRKGMKELPGTIEAPKGDRFDCIGPGKKFPIVEKSQGIAHMLAEAIETEQPYPVKGLMIYRFDPLYSVPDTKRLIHALDKLDLIVAVDVNWSNTAWYADVVLPETHFLERGDPIQERKGLKPILALRKKVVDPLLDTRPAWQIFKELAERLGFGDKFFYTDIDDYNAWKLSETGIELAEFEKTGVVNLAKDKIYYDRQTGLKFKTPSKKIEVISSKMEENGLESLPPYENLQVPEGKLRLIIGRNPLYTQGSMSNNKFIKEVLWNHPLWMHKDVAARLGVKDGDSVLVRNEIGSGTATVFTTDGIHPEAVFMPHGFGKKAKAQKYAYGVGLADSELQGVVSDFVGGSAAMQECFVEIEKM